MIQPTFRTDQERLGAVNQQAPLGAERQELLAATLLNPRKAHGGKLVESPAHCHDRILKWFFQLCWRPRPRGFFAEEMEKQNQLGRWRQFVGTLRFPRPEMFAQIRCKFRNEELISGNGKGDASRDKPGAEAGRESFGRIHDYSFELRLRQINVLPDFCRRIVVGSPPEHEEQRRLTDPSLEELVKARQKHRQRPIPVPFLQQPRRAEEWLRDSLRAWSRYGSLSKGICLFSNINHEH